MTHTHTKVKQSYCCLGESFSGLDKRSNQLQYSSKLKLSSVGGSSSVQFHSLKEMRKLVEEKSEDNRSWFMKLKERNRLYSIKL